MSIYANEVLSLSNLERPEVRADPYPFYARLRAEDPVHWDEDKGFWVLTRYADIASVYLDPRFSRAQGLLRGFQRLPASEQGPAGPVYDTLSKTTFYTDPPHHTRLRGVLTEAFSPRTMELIRPPIQRIVDDLLDAVQAAGRMDAIHDFAYILPILVIAKMLGLPEQERQRFKLWSDDLFAVLGTVGHSSEDMQRASQSLAEMTEYVGALSRARLHEPRQDLLSALAADVEFGGRLSQEELVANVSMLLSAGHETTSNLIGNGLLALLRNPLQLERLRTDPGLAPLAIEEMLRYDNPVQIAYRSAAEDVELNGRLIRQGDLVNMVLGAGNRDPERYSDPDRFDIARDEGRHLGFGLGIHFCIGAALVRLEGQIAFTTILRRLPGLALTGETWEWQEQPIFRGVKSLPVAF
jgi:cytochrome P450